MSTKRSNAQVVAAGTTDNVKHVMGLARQPFKAFVAFKTDLDATDAALWLRWEHRMTCCFESRHSGDALRRSQKLRGNGVKCSIKPGPRKWRYPRHGELSRHLAGRNSFCAASSRCSPWPAFRPMVMASQNPTFSRSNHGVFRF